LFDIYFHNNQALVLFDLLQFSNVIGIMIDFLSKIISYGLLLGVLLFSPEVFARNEFKNADMPKDTSVEVTKTPTMDELFVRLSKAKDEVDAKGIADQIERIWAKSGSDTADLMMSRAMIAMQAKQYTIALDLVDSVIALEPKWAEAWNKRATILFLSDDYDGSMRDIRQVLALEPRHFAAIGGISLIYQAMENKKLALKSARQALAIYPFMAGAKAFVDKNARAVDGDDL
jgi:tetratricopeptide (TPR) repeat protein